MNANLHSLLQNVAISSVFFSAGRLPFCLLFVPFLSEGGSTRQFPVNNSITIKNLRAEKFSQLVIPEPLKKTIRNRAKY